MLVSVIFFLFISLAIVSGLVTPTVREFKNASVNLNSKKAYFLAESGVEDAIYRIRNNKTIGGSETLALDSNSATTTITTSGSEKQIESLGDVNNFERTVNVKLVTSGGVSFNYGVQVGQGGIELEGSGTINGNVYANGPITGDSSAIITGTAISANSPALVADQTNGSGTPANNVNFGNANGTQDIAQSFQITTNDSPLNKIQLYIKKTSTPVDATVKIVNDAGGSPGTTVYATGTLVSSSVGTTYGWVNVSFTTNPVLDNSTTYWLVVDAATSSTKFYTIGAASGGYANGLGKIGQFSGTWNNTTPSGLDYYFGIYLGGVTGLIAGSSGSQFNQLHVGTVSGTAQAHTVNYTNSTGLIYCASGTGNNKSCTAQTDPVYIAMPVTDANIADWKDQAEGGGIINGNYSVGWAGATLGPKKIVGNLTVSGGGTLTVSGTLWVTGNITLDGGALIRLSAGYGTNDGVLIADGNITISGGGHATGSGTSGSYIMMLSTSSSGSAISVSGGAGAVIVYAPEGTINISGGAALKEATGYRITVDGGSSITYESGLANTNFSSGPSGEWTVEEWKEGQ